MDDENVILFGKGHQLGVQRRGADAAHRVCGQGDDHILCLAGHILRDVLHIRQEAVLLGQRVIPRLCAAQQTARDEHRVAGSGQQHGVALVAQHHTNVAHALLTAGAAGYLIRRDLYAEAALVVAAHSIQQLRQVAQAVLPVLRVGSGIHHGLADVLGRREVRRADAQIINGTALCFQSYLAFVQCGEDLVAEQIQSFGKLHILIPLFNTDHFDNRAILARFSKPRNEKGRWGRKFQLSVVGSEGCFTGRKPSQSRLTPCQLSRRASFMSANHQMQKSSPFRGSWRAKRD